jgi:superfamily II DNA or RNA helicase
MRVIDDKELSKGGGKRQGGDLFIVDNSDANWKVKDYLREWTEIAHTFDIATGYFEIGALLALDGQWQKLDKLRILMGDEVSKRTRKALLAGVETVTRLLDASIEKEKEKNDFLSGVPAIVEALRSKQIECRVYAKEKFHAKAYITHSNLSVVGSSALVGSSNFTLPGLTDNVELNIQLRREVEILQEWYERHWDVAEDITPNILQVVERHTREYRPFDVYAKALQEYFRGHEMSVGEWELTRSRLYKKLDQYQKEGYQALMKIVRQQEAQHGHGGAFLCDGVGLGKTFIGMMVIERLVEHERKRVALFVPKAARVAVWSKALRDYLPGISGVFGNLEVFNHTDLYRTNEEIQTRLAQVKERADVIVIDEAHHFRNPGIKGEGARGPSRYRRLSEIAAGKSLFLLTATPINNRLVDLQHMIELFTQQQPDYFKAAPLGIHSLHGHFRKMEKDLDKAVLPQVSDKTEAAVVETNQVEAEQVLAHDALFRALVVQRSRAYVKESQRQHGGSQAMFPQREDPKVAEYSVKKTYGKLLKMIETAFSKEKPLFSLAIYDPSPYFKGTGEIDAFVRGRQKQVVALIRTQFLKRFESSARSFELSCETLYRKLLAFAIKHAQSPREIAKVERLKAQHAEPPDYMRKLQARLFDDQGDLAEVLEDEIPEDLVTEEMLAETPELSRELYRVEDILTETFYDLEQLLDFLEELRKFKPENDDKLRALIKLLKTDPVLKNQKVLIFTEYLDTARYLEEELEKAGINGLDEVDGETNHSRRGDIIRQFAPYYNGSSSEELKAEGLDETRVLISTDVLSEGLNLQDATRLINYDLHWNPVRLMQRIGRVDRRLNPDVEEHILRDHPEQKGIRGTTAYWNFLPPDELDELLRLYRRVSHKTLRISRVFGIEGKKLLRPEDDFEALKDFTLAYEGTTTPAESLHLEYQKLLKDFPDLAERLAQLPGRVFSGKSHPSDNARAVFFCYSLPAAGASDGNKALSSDASTWTEEAGSTGWYLYDLATQQIIEEPTEIIELIRSTPDTPRRHELPDGTLSEIRGTVEKHIKNSYLRRVQAPVGVKARLKAWMEIS